MGTTTETISSSPSILFYAFSRSRSFFPSALYESLQPGIVPRTEHPSFEQCLKHAHSPSHFGWRKDHDVVSVNLLRRLYLVMIEHLHFVLNVIRQFEREPFRRIEDDLYVVGFILIARMNAERGLLLNCFGKLVTCRSDKILIQKSRIVPVHRRSQGLPRLQIVPHGGRLGLLLQSPWTLKMRRLDAHVRLSRAERRHSGENRAHHEKRSKHHYFSHRISFPRT